MRTQGFSLFQGVAARHEGSSENVGQTFQFAHDLASRLSQEHEQTGKFALHLAVRFSSFQGVVRDDMNDSFYDCRWLL